MKNRWLIAIFFVFLIVLAVNYSAVASALEKSAMDFSLNNWDGRTVSLKDLKGKVVVLTFSYAYCSARCPIITGRLYYLDKTMNAPGDVVYLHMSVDPDNDTPERRKKYFNLYGIDATKDGRWMFLSGQKNKMSEIWGFYGVTAKKVKDRRLPEKYYMQYDPKVVVIDSNGLIRYEVGFDFSEEEIKSLIEKISSKPSIRFSETKFDFGTVKEGDIVSHDFEFINEGNGVLKIKDLIPA